ncbi:MAG: hypothetical protein OHK0013_38690 [Sandaracinaceae bacterium]
MSRSLMHVVVLATLVLSPLPALAQSTKPGVVAPTLDPTVIVAASGEIGFLQGRQRGSDVVGIYGPTGHLRGFVGHELYDDGLVHVALGYEGSIGGGIDTLTASSPGRILHSRQMVGLALRGGAIAVTLSTGVAFMYAPEYDIGLVGYTLQAQLGMPAGPVWIGVPLGLDAWPDWGVAAFTLGLSIGGISF